MEKVNLTPADYGLTEDIKGIFTASAINYVVNETLADRWMSRDEKLFYIYQVLLSSI